MTTRTRTDALLLAGFCAFLFFYGLHQFGLIGADEPRYAQVASEMLERRDWILPTLGGQPWLEKPPLYYWQAALAYSIFGVSDWSARLPSALDATLLVLAIYFFLRRFRAGSELDGALMTASSAAIVGYARAASMDMALAATFTMSMLCWWGWRESRQKVYLGAFYAFLALGTLAKGPIAPFLALLVILLFSLLSREPHLLRKTFWLPGMISFCLIALPWYLAVQARAPQFFHEFILEHNLGRFSRNLYHHTEPFWYYLPVIVLGLVPWIVFIATSLSQTWLEWFTFAGRKGTEVDSEICFRLFASVWLIVPVVFFSLSQSKLPGYILPAVPAGCLLLAEFLRQHLKAKPEDRPSSPLVALHALIAAAPIVPALLLSYILTQHRMPGGQPMLVALAVAFVLCAAIALTLVRPGGLRLLRFVTLIPVVLTIGTVLKLSSSTLDEELSARPLAQELAAIDTHRLPLAVYHVRRELEYGLTFYRNQLTLNYDWGRVPGQEHLLVASENSQVEIARIAPGRRVSYLGHSAAQHVDYFWIAAAPASPTK